MYIYIYLPSSFILPQHNTKKNILAKSPPAAKPRRNAPRQAQQLGVAQALRALRGVAVERQPALPELRRGALQGRRQRRWRRGVWSQGPWGGAWVGGMGTI